MKFAALPLAGGIYDQHPNLIRDWLVIFEQKSIHQKEEQRRQQAEAKKTTGKKK